MIFTSSKDISEFIEYCARINTSLTGNQNPFRDASLLESTIGSSIYQKTAEDCISSIFRGIIKNHPFIDGNKRTAVTVLYELLRQFGLRTSLNSNYTYRLAIDVATTDIPVYKISERLRIK